jgi:hypothetical protein
VSSDRLGFGIAGRNAFCSALHFARRRGRARRRAPRARATRPAPGRQETQARRAAEAVQARGDDRARRWFAGRLMLAKPLGPLSPRAFGLKARSPTGLFIGQQARDTSAGVRARRKIGRRAAAASTARRVAARVARRRRAISILGRGTTSSPQDFACVRPLSCHTCISLRVGDVRRSRFARDVAVAPRLSMASFQRRQS